MKAVAYSIKAFEKELLARFNNKKHDITLISNRLTPDTVSYAEGKDAVIVFSADDLSAGILRRLKDLGVRYVTTRTTGTDHIDLEEAEKLGIQVASIGSYSPESIAEHALTLMLALCRNIIPAHRQSMQYDFTLDDLVGITLRDRTIGIVGFGETGQALARILTGFGARILVTDVNDVSAGAKACGAQQSDLTTVLKEADILSFHVPLTEETRHMVNADTIRLMKDGVMLINVSRGAVFNSRDVYDALQQNKISKIGMDVYEFEHNVFFFDHSRKPVADKLLKAFIQHSRVLLTPHQAFLTKEAVGIISERTISNLDRWAAQSADQVAVCQTRDFAEVK